MANQLPLCKTICSTPLSYNDKEGNYTFPSVPPYKDDELGMLRAEIDGSGNLRVYRFIQMVASGSAACAAGAPIYASATDTNKTSGDTRSAQSTVNQVLGVGIGVIGLGNKGWVQIYGPLATSAGVAQTTTLNSGTCAIGVALIGDASHDLKVATVAVATAPTNKVIGWAWAASTLTAVPTFVECW